MDFLDYMTFVCFAGALIGFTLLIIGGIFELVDYLTKGTFKTAIVNFFSKESDE